MDPEEGGGERGGKKEGGKGDEGPFGVTRGTSGVGLVQYVFQFRQKMVAVLYSKRSIHKKSCVYASAGITITYDFCWTCSINRIHHTVARAFTHPTDPKKFFCHSETREDPSSLPAHAPVEDRNGTWGMEFSAKIEGNSFSFEHHYRFIGLLKRQFMLSQKLFVLRLYNQPPSVFMTMSRPEWLQGLEQPMNSIVFLDRNYCLNCQCP